MLPRLAAADRSFRKRSDDSEFRESGIDRARGRSVAPCTRSDVRVFLDPASALAACKVCANCPIATACLADAMAIDLAYRLGRDAYGITGLCAGVWFEPGRAPQRIVDERSDSEKMAAAA